MLHPTMLGDVGPTLWLRLNRPFLFFLYIGLATPVAPVLTPRTPTRCQSLASEAKPPVPIPDNPNEVPHRPLSSPHSIRLRQLSRLSRSRNGSPPQTQRQASPKTTNDQNKKVVLKNPEYRYVVQRNEAKLYLH